MDYKAMTHFNKIIYLIVSLLFFTIIISSKSLYLNFLTQNLDCNISFIQSLLKNYNLDYFKYYYPNYGMVIMILLFIYKFYAFFSICLLFIFLSFIYNKKLINKSYLIAPFIILIVLFLFEFGLEFINYKKIIGLNFNGREIGSNLILKQQLGVDSNGINFFLKDTENYMSKYSINQQGFRNAYNFDSLTINTLKDTSKLIMFVGDSHTEGCCADPIEKSFVDLVDAENGISAINFGVGGTDPLQYKLIVDKYLAIIKPDVLVIPFCLGNDFMNTDRKAYNKLPLHFQTNFNWLDTRLPITHSNYKPDTYFKNWEEAKMFYIEQYTVLGNKINFFEQHIINQSNLLSFTFYLSKGLKNLKSKSINSITNNTKLKESFISYKYINEIKNECNKIGVKLILLGVPTIKDIGKDIETINQDYKRQLKDIPILIPTNINREDFVSYNNDHLVNSGHQKFADFILLQLNK